jgi:cysteine dioxygenase
MVSIEKLVDGLRSIPDEGFACDNIHKYLGDNPVESDSITPYFFWSPEYYTRNLVYKDERFEVLVICWEKGVISRIHDHSGQQCWMTVPIGKLHGQNFKVVEIDESRGFCRLTETDEFEISNCRSAVVPPDEPVHQVGNLPEYGDRAVSIHIYSKPYMNCGIYCRDTDTYKIVDLSYTSIGGKLC